MSLIKITVTPEHNVNHVTRPHSLIDESLIEIKKIPDDSVLPGFVRPNGNATMVRFSKISSHSHGLIFDDKRYVIVGMPSKIQA